MQDRLQKYQPASGWLVGIRSVVLGEVTDQDTSNQTADDCTVQADVIHAQGEVDQSKSTDSNQNTSDVGTSSQSAEQLLLGSVLIGLNKEGTDDGSEDTDGSQSHGRAIPVKPKPADTARAAADRRAPE